MPKPTNVVKPVKPLHDPVTINPGVFKLSLLGAQDGPAEPITVPPGGGSMTPYDKGYVVHTPLWGDVVLTTPAWNTWHGLSDADRLEIGWPTSSTEVLPDKSQRTQCQNGVVVLNTPGHVPNSAREYWTVVGRIYDKWLTTGAAPAFKRSGSQQGFSPGWPFSQRKAVGAGVMQSFENGDIYDIRTAGAKATAAVHGAIRDHWQTLGGATGFLGFPLSDETPIPSTDVIRQTFQGGNIYWSPRTGAFEVHGDVLAYYELECGGATGELGLPVTDTGSLANGGAFNDFEHGCIVWHPSGAYAGAHRFRTLTTTLQHFDSQGSDGALGGAQDLYVFATVSTTTNQGFVKRRIPSSGDGGGGFDVDKFDPNAVVAVTPVRHDLVIQVQLEGWDADSTSADDRLGEIDGHWTADNLWGTQDTGQTETNGDFKATYQVVESGAVDPSAPWWPARWWGFSNPEIAHLTWDQFARTFSDVDEGESDIHAFDHIYYSAVYDSIAAGGTCFGIALESAYADAGRSVYPEPIDEVVINDIQNDTSNYAVAARDHVAIKHGYQVGANVIDWSVLCYALGLSHNPKAVFTLGKALNDCGISSLLCMVHELGDGHCIRPFRWDDSSSPWKIEVGDPNWPSTEGGAPRVLTIDPVKNTWSYLSDFGSSKGDMLYSTPFFLVDSEPRTPFWEVLALIATGAGVFLLADCDVTHVASGATSLVAAGVSAVTSAKDIDHAKARAAKVAPIPLVSSGGGGAKPQLWVQEGGPTLTFGVRPHAGKTATVAMRGLGGGVVATSAASAGGSTPPTTTTKAKRKSTPAVGPGGAATGAISVQALPQANGLPGVVVTPLDSTGASEVTLRFVSEPAPADGQRADVTLTLAAVPAGAAVHASYADDAVTVHATGGQPAATVQWGSKAASAVTLSATPTAIKRS